VIQKDRNFLIELAKKYYFEGSSQQEIAKYYGISRPSVSNLLKQCKEEKIVEIRIQESETSLVKALADRLKKNFSLQTAIVVPTANDISSTLNAAGLAAAGLLESRLHDKLKIGLSWGSTLYHVVDALVPQHVIDVEVIQLAGSLGMTNPSYDGYELTRNLSQKLNATSRLIQAPVIVKNLELKKMLLQEHPILETMNQMKKIDLALVGMSSDAPENSSMVREGFMTKEEALYIQSLGGIGHLCALHYDKNGEILDISENERVIGIEYETLKEIPEVIGVACGAEKSEAILGSIKGGLVNSIITDENTALRMLSQS
jgi:DNA-binding transcriptional regulator LsrR (DeoR family)